MIKFIVLAVVAFMVFPFIFKMLGSGALLMLVLIVVAALVLKNFMPVLGFGIIILLIIALSLRTSQNSGKDRAGQVHEAGKAVGKDLLTRLLEKLGLEHAGAAAGGFEGMADATDNANLAREICLNTSFARLKFGDAYTTYCGAQDAGIFAKLKAILDGGATGAAGPVFQFLADNASSLEQNQSYLYCLRSVSQTLPNISECYQKPYYDSTHTWRLCTELALQLKHDDLMVRAPLAQEIALCRARAAQ